MFVFKIADVNMHAKQALLTPSPPPGLKNSFRFLFLFSFLLVVSKIIHFLMALGDGQIPRGGSSLSRLPVHFEKAAILRRTTFNCALKLKQSI